MSRAATGFTWYRQKPVAAPARACHAALQHPAGRSGCIRGGTAGSSSRTQQGSVPDAGQTRCQYILAREAWRHAVGGRGSARLFPVSRPRCRDRHWRARDGAACEGQQCARGGYRLASACRRVPHRDHAEGLGAIHVRRRGASGRTPATACTRDRASRITCSTTRRTWNTWRSLRRRISRRSTSRGRARFRRRRPGPGLPDRRVRTRLPAPRSARARAAPPPPNRRDRASRRYAHNKRRRRGRPRQHSCGSG